VPKGDPCPACPADDQRAIVTRERCMRCYQREWRAANPDRKRAYEQAHVDRKKAREAEALARGIYPAPLGPPPINLTETSYIGTHHRVTALRGPARDHTCACGRPAAEWAYTPQPGLEQWRRIAKGKPLPRDGKTTDAPYSLHPADYAPSCFTCHRPEWHQARRDRTTKRTDVPLPDLDPPQPRKAPERPARPVDAPPLWADRAAERDRAALQAIAGPTWYQAKVAAHVEPQPDGCHLWTGYRDRLGYGYVYVPPIGKSLAHRVNYLAHRGPIAHGLTLTHTCHNPGCVNPDHMRPNTQRANLQASASTPTAINAAKTHCPKGHPYEGDNLADYTAVKGKTGKTYRNRDCRTCRREQMRTTEATIKQARLILGLTYDAYIARYGRSLTRARRIIDTTT
jgi:hypothetical protein